MAKRFVITNKKFFELLTKLHVFSEAFITNIVFKANKIFTVTYNRGVKIDVFMSICQSNVFV